MRQGRWGEERDREIEDAKQGSEEEEKWMKKLQKVMT